MIFNTYNSAMDRNIDEPWPKDPVLNWAPLPADEHDKRAFEEEPVVSIKELGQSIPEGNRFGTFIQGLQSAIRIGVGTVELATGMGGGHENVGADSYGQDARRELRELAKINDVEIKSIHTPSNIGNLSGYNQQERGFSDEYRKMELEEVKKAIDFAADVAGKGAIVVHTGEYPRDMTDAKWNKRDEYGNYMFTSYEEEENRNVKYMVDDRTGKLITEIRKSQVLRLPQFKRKPNPNHGGRLEYIGYVSEDELHKYDKSQLYYEDGKWYRFLNETDPNDLFKRIAEWDNDEVRFKTEKMTWRDYEKKAQEWNKYYKRPDGREWLPEEVFFADQMNMRILQSRGSSLYHGRFYPQILKAEKKIRDALKFFEKVEKDLPEDRRWEMLRNYVSDVHRYIPHEVMDLVVHDKIMPTEALKKALEDIELEKRYIHEASATADANADESYETLTHVVPIEVYAKDQTAKSYAEAGIYAMMQSKQNPHAKGDLFIAPENIFPEMGYGSHPQELIELVKKAREKMVSYLTEKYIEDPKAQRDRDGNIIKVPNPYYMGIDKKEAEKLAEKHIKATFDTQHLGMWWKHFAAKPGETIEERRKRFNKWYMEQVEEMEKAGIIGHIHVVDSSGAGHHHLPAGQGVFPVVEAVKYLKKKGYSGSMISEGYGENNYSTGRILTETWRAFGNPIVRDAGLFSGAPGAAPLPGSWNYIQHGYFGQTQSPYFIFGTYAPSNDWSLWSQVPME